VSRYIDDPAFRRRILMQLNREELRHCLGQRVFLGQRGEIRSSLRQGQEEELGSLGLRLNFVVHWNAIHMQEVITQLKVEGSKVTKLKRLLGLRRVALHHLRGNV
jgi:TnpA family transposase